MALEASHIRFALEIKDQLNISNYCDYILGSVYPDSRYVTKIDRQLTHPKRSGILEIANKNQDDFYKGWFTHLLLDDLQYKLIQKSFPDTASDSDPGEKSDLWIKRTAIKILQDIDDAKKFDIGVATACLENYRSIHNEDAEKIKIYNKSIVGLYSDIENLNANSYKILWESWGLGEDVEKKLIKQTEIYKENDGVMRAVKDNFDLILQEAGKI